MSVHLFVMFRNFVSTSRFSFRLDFAVRQLCFRFREHMAGVHGERDFHFDHDHGGVGAAAAAAPAPHR